jgi:putative glycerol-1-phosphate prenyltransferase
LKNQPIPHIYIHCGSQVKTNRIELFSLKEKDQFTNGTFPGNPSQISNEADAILFPLH